MNTRRKKEDINEFILKFLKEEEVNGAKPKTIAAHTSILINADRFKPLSTEWTKEDINDFILGLQKEYKTGSVEVYKIVIKKYWKWAGKPEIVAHVKAKIQKTNLRRENIPTPRDITLMIETTSSLMYKALFAFTFESGGRISEIVRVIKVEEIEDTDKGMIVPVHETKAKEDIRRILCVFSAQYIRNYVQIHNLKPSDALFPISPYAAYVMFKKIAKEAGIKKPITPHKLRHGQATDMVLRGYQEGIIKKKLGLANDSRMLARYQHVVDEDVINATAEKTGTLHVNHEPLENIAKADPLLQATENALQITKLKEENVELRTRLDERDREIEEMKAGQAGSDERIDQVWELLSAQNKFLEDLGQGKIDTNSPDFWQRFARETVGFVKMPNPKKG